VSNNENAQTFLLLKIIILYFSFHSKRKQFKIRNMEVWAVGDLPVKEGDEEGNGHVGFIKHFF